MDLCFAITLEGVWRAECNRSRDQEAGLEAVIRV